ncbi:effector-associated domain 2-containing protein [Streptomyces sp. CA-249302]|uniref:VMAP-C domain-containing protein n=1 Tax=Streptomyces sp. CA-249302 TaxID=3240058 RepID=UPI003D8A3C6B
MTSEGGEGRGGSALRIRQRIGEETLMALLAVRALDDPRARARLVELVGEALGHPAALREQATARLQLVELFRFCAHRPGGLTALAHQLLGLETDCSQTPLVHRLADEWTAVGSLTGLPEVTDSWEFLAGMLSVLPVASSIRTALVHTATAGRASAPPPYAENPWHDFLHMAGQGAPRDGLPPWMLYLDRSTDFMDYRVAFEVLARNRQWALRCGLAELLDRDRRDRVNSPTAPVRRQLEYLAIHITPDPLESGRYTVSHSFMSPARGPYWERGAALPQVSGGDLVRAVSGIVRRTEEAAGERPEHLWLEFVLPFELLNLPVDWWPLDPGKVPHVPLARHYPVVIRSLDRLRNTAWHEFWQHRWLQLSIGEHPSQSVHVNVARRGGGHLRGLKDRLDGDQRIVATVLSEPPRADGHGSRELEAALRSGLPVVIWHRADRTTEEFLGVVDGLLADGLRRFPANVTAYRRRTAVQDPDGQDEWHPARHLTVLWDDPDHKPVLPDM